MLEDDPELRSLLTRGPREEGFYVDAAGRASELLELLPGLEPDVNTLDLYIARLRRKLSALPAAPEMTTVHGVGYSPR